MENCLCAETVQSFHNKCVKCPEEGLLLDSVGSKFELPTEMTLAKWIYLSSIRFRLDSDSLPSLELIAKFAMQTIFGLQIFECKRESLWKSVLAFAPGRELLKFKVWTFDEIFFVKLTSKKKENPRHCFNFTSKWNLNWNFPKDSRLSGTIATKKFSVFDGSIRRLTKSIAKYRTHWQPNIAPHGLGAIVEF